LPAFATTEVALKPTASQPDFTNSGNVARSATLHGYIPTLPATGSYHHSRLKASNEELRCCRQNPLLADQLYPGLVVCLECGVLAKRLVRSPKCHARRAHPEVDYPAKWPTAPLFGKGVHKADLEQHHDYVRDNRDAVNTGRRRTYDNKLKKAEEDPTSPEAQWHKKELKRLHDRGQQVYWGGGDETVPGSRASEKVRKHARAGRCNERAKELLEERKAAAQANPTGPEATLLEAERKRDADKQTAIRLHAALDDAPDGTREIVHYLWDHPEATNEETRRATGTNLGDRQMTRLREKYKVPGPKGRPPQKPRK